MDIFAKSLPSASGFSRIFSETWGGSLFELQNACHDHFLLYAAAGRNGWYPLGYGFSITIFVDFSFGM